jgi:hypothetical protein
VTSVSFPGCALNTPREICSTRFGAFEGHLTARTSLTHSWGVLLSGRRLSALSMLLALLAGNASLCEGWLATPAARMACCTAGATCPMHQSHSAATGTSHYATQTDADACCAGSERDGSAPPSGFVSASPLALVVGPVPTAFDIELHVVARRPAVPVPVAETPRHLLLTVLQV